MQRWCEIYADESGRLIVEFYKLRHGAPRFRTEIYESVMIEPGLSLAHLGGSIDVLRVVG